jgi:hypothetical protein
MISGDSQRQTGNFNVQRKAHISPLQFFIEHIFLDECNTCIFELRIKDFHTVHGNNIQRVDMSLHSADKSLLLLLMLHA